MHYADLVSTSLAVEVRLVDEADDVTELANISLLAPGNELCFSSALVIDFVLKGI